MTMLKKMAAAIEGEIARQEMVLTDPLSLRRMMAERAARAALLAIREPSEGMRIAALNTTLPEGGEPPLYENCHRAMIDAILEGNTADDLVDRREAVIESIANVLSSERHRLPLDAACPGPEDFALARLIQSNLP